MDSLRFLDNVTEGDYQVALSDQQALNEELAKVIKGMQDAQECDWTIEYAKFDVTIQPSLYEKWRRLMYYARTEQVEIVLPSWVAGETA